MRDLTARNVFLTLTTLYAILQMLQWVGVLEIDRDTTPVWVTGLLGVFIVVWLGSGLATLATAFRRSRADARRPGG